MENLDKAKIEQIVRIRKQVNSYFSKNSSLSKTFFILSIIVFLYWFIGKSLNVYRFAIVGAIWEILWLFMILIQFGLPVISLVFLIKEKFSFRSLYLYTFIISVSTILLMILT